MLQHRVALLFIAILRLCGKVEALELHLKDFKANLHESEQTSAINQQGASTTPESDQSINSQVALINNNAVAKPNNANFYTPC